MTGPLGVASTEGDPAKAKQLFAEGLKEEGYSSVSQLPSLTLIYDQSYKSGTDTVAAIVNEWKQELGLNVKLSGVQPTDLFNQWYDTAGNTKLAMWYGSWGADYQDPQDFTSLFFGKGTQLNGFNYGQNTSSNAKTQQAIQDELAKADTTQDQATRLKLYQDAEQKLVNDVP